MCIELLLSTVTFSIMRPLAEASMVLHVESSLKASFAASTARSMSAYASKETKSIFNFHLVLHSCAMCIKTIYKPYHLR